MWETPRYITHLALASEPSPSLFALPLPSLPQVLDGDVCGSLRRDFFFIYISVNFLYVYLHIVDTHVHSRRSGFRILFTIFPVCRIQATRKESWDLLFPQKGNKTEEVLCLFIYFVIFVGYFLSLYYFSPLLSGMPPCMFGEKECCVKISSIFLSS